MHQEILNPEEHKPPSSCSVHSCHPGGRMSVTLDCCPLEAFRCTGPGGDFFGAHCMLVAGSDAKTFPPSFCGYESERMPSSFKRLVGGAQLLRSLEWLIQPLVGALSYPAPPLWLLECLQRCLGNRIQISERISQPLPYLALRTVWHTDMQPDLGVIKSTGAQTVFFLELWWKRHNILIHFSHYFNTDFQYFGTARFCASSPSFIILGILQGHHLQDNGSLQNLGL